MIKIIWMSKEIDRFTDDISIEYLRNNGIEFTDKFYKADILLSMTQGRRHKILSKIWFAKKKLVWTNEPYFDTTYSDFMQKKRLVMNVYSGNVFLNNLHFLGSYHYNSSNNLG